jgi:hypothetical protein
MDYCTKGITEALTAELNENACFNSHYEKYAYLAKTIEELKSQVSFLEDRLNLSWQFIKQGDKPYHQYGDFLTEIMKIMDQAARIGALSLKKVNGEDIAIKTLQQEFENLMTKFKVGKKEDDKDFIS